MVVAHIQSNTSAFSQKKSRRKMSKKPARTPPANGEDQATSEDPVDTDETHLIANETEEVQWNDDDEVMIDADPPAPAPSDAPTFPPLPASALQSTLKSDIRRIPIPPHRMTPLKQDWVNIFSPLTEMLQLQVRMNVPRKCVEIRVSSPMHTA